MKLTTLLADAVATGAGTAYTTEGYEESSAQAVVTGIGTATVVIEGSIDGTTYLTLDTVTADGIITVPLLPHVRANVTAYTAGTINATLVTYNK